MRAEIRLPRWWRSGLRSAFLAANAFSAAIVAAGCIFFQGPDVERTAFPEARLDPAEIRAKSTEADRLYASPRTVDRVKKSFDLAVGSVSPVNGYAGLWQAARAASWLADELPDKDRAMSFARQGVAVGREATRLAADRVESHYFLAQALAQLSDLQRTPRFLEEMAKSAEEARRLDEKYDRAGPDRFLGLLHLNTEGQPFVGFGDLDKALAHLKRAVDLFPDAENRNAYAETLIRDEEYEEARAQLDAAIAAPAPPDYEAEHAGWVKRAQELKSQIAGK